uniref:Chromogranin-A n=1 Tax=Myripristis murdjan TaxID=586833 RepID=A0A667YLV9_9TELE
ELAKGFCVTLKSKFMRPLSPQVMKCIVEALTDVLSRPHSLPISQDCLVKMKTDDRLVTILRHHNFLKELQHIAVQGESQIPQCRGDVCLFPETFQEGNTEEKQTMFFLFLLFPGDESDEERDAPQAKSEETKFPKENKEESGEGLEKKRSPFFSHDDTQEEREQEEDEGEMKRGSRDSLKRWSKRAKSLPAKKRAGEKEVQPLGGEQEVPHHSKEAVAEEEDKSRGETRRSPEEKELQMIARRTPEERRVMEEEGSASRKPEEPEIESLAAIESELESVAQKLHELRRG